MTNNTTIHDNTDKTNNGRRRRAGSRLGTAAIVLAALIGAGSSALPATAFADAPPASVTSDPMTGDPISIDELEALTAELDARRAELAAEAGPSASSTSWTTILTSLGTKVGEKVFSEVLDLGLDALLDELGLGGDDVAGALDAIQSSIDEVQKSVDKNTELLKELRRELDWSTFKNAQHEVQVSAGAIDGATALIAEYERQGAEPTQADIDNMWTSTYGAIETLASRIAGSEGTMSLLLDAVNTDDADDAWSYVEQYRDLYRGVLAQGLINLTWLLDYEDVSSLSLGVHYPVAFDTASELVDAMYGGVGVAYQDPVKFHKVSPTTPWVLPPRPAGATIHLPTAMPGTFYASSARPVAPGEDVDSVHSRGAVEAMYESLQDEFEAAPSGGRTFEQHLKSQGFPTVVVLPDSFRGDAVGSPTVVWEQTEVLGNDVVTVTKQRTYANYQVMGRERKAMHDAAIEDAPYRGYTDRNSGGLAISSDPAAVELARTGFHVEVGEATGADDIGMLTVENPGDYDTLYFIDAESGQWLGSADISNGSVGEARLIAPPSGEVQIVIGQNVPGAPKVMVPVASAIVEAGDATPNEKGKVMFSAITTVDSLS